MSLFASCKDDSQSPQPASTTVSPRSTVKATYDAAKINQSFDELAKALAVSMTSKDVRTSLHNQIEKKFDGDYDVLYKSLKGTVVADGKSFEVVLANDLSMAKQLPPTQKIEKLESVASQIPKLQVAMPVNFKKWDANNFVPLVTWMPAGEDDKTIQRVKAYDANGNVHWLNGQEAPDFPVIVLSMNERTDENGSTFDTIGADDEAGSGPGSGGGSSSGGGGSGGNYNPLPPRNWGNREHLDEVKMHNWSEGWLMGWPEYRLQIKTASGIDQINFQFPHNVGLWEDEDRDMHVWKPIGTRFFNGMFYWYPEYGNYYICFWSEIDGGGPISFTVTISGQNYGFSISDGDDILGSNIVNYQDPNGTTYSCGNVDWRISARP
jgi:hypothetical protein